MTKDPAAPAEPEAVPKPLPVLDARVAANALAFLGRVHLQGREEAVALVEACTALEAIVIRGRADG